jgi:hypothetical protein
MDKASMAKDSLGTAFALLPRFQRPRLGPEIITVTSQGVQVGGEVRGAPKIIGTEETAMMGPSWPN